MEKLIYSKKQTVSYGVFKLPCGKLDKGDYKVTVEIIDGGEQCVNYITLSKDVYGTSVEKFKGCEKVTITKDGKIATGTITAEKDTHNYILISMGQKKNTSTAEVKLYKVDGDTPTPPKPDPTPDPTPTPSGEYKLWVGTLKEYNAIKHNDKTIYFIKEG